MVTVKAGVLCVRCTCPSGDAFLLELGQVSSVCGKQLLHKFVDLWQAQPGLYVQVLEESLVGQLAVTRQGCFGGELLGYDVAVQRRGQRLGEGARLDRPYPISVDQAGDLYHGVGGQVGDRTPVRYVEAKQGAVVGE